MERRPWQSCDSGCLMIESLHSKRSLIKDGAFGHPPRWRHVSISPLDSLDAPPLSVTLTHSDHDYLGAQPWPQQHCMSSTRQQALSLFRRLLRAARTWQGSKEVSLRG